MNICYRLRILLEPGIGSGIGTSESGASICRFRIRSPVLGSLAFHCHFQVSCHQRAMFHDMPLQTRSVSALAAENTFSMCPAICQAVDRLPHLIEDASLEVSERHRQPLPIIALRAEERAVTELRAIFSLPALEIRCERRRFLDPH